MLWTIAHAPKTASEIAGNADAVCRLKKWALSFSLNKPQKPLLIHGPCGSAKSAAVRAVASELGWELIEILPPNKNELERWEKRLSEVLAGGSLFGTSSLILCEDVDKWHLSKVRGLMPKLSAKIRECSVPLVLISQDAYDRRISSLRPYCELLEFKAINNSTITGVLAKICSENHLNVKKEQLQQIALNSAGDLRAAINDLQALNFNSSRESQKKQFEILRAVFRSPSYKATRGMDLGPLMERSTLKLYASENLPSEFFDYTDMASGFNFLSRADIFDGRIMRRQYWGYLRYSSSLLLWGVSSCRKHIRAGFVPYSFPSYIRKMGATRSKRAIYKNSGKKIAPKCHCTTKHAASYIPLICAQLEYCEQKEECGRKICTYYRFEEDELASMCGVSKNSLYITKSASKRKSTSKSKKS